MSVSSHATTPAEVLTSYNAYRTALDKNDKKSATKHAYEAWQTAEKLLGDHKATGDLAFNYAEITPPRRIKNRHKNYEKRAKAYKRAIKLVHFHGDDVPVRELERRINLAELELTVRRGNRIGKFGTLKDIEKAIHSHGQEGSTFDADLHALYAQYYLANRKFEKAIEYGEKAIKLYESRTDGYVSKHEYFIRVFKGDSHIALSDKNDDLSEKVNAALEYQNVIHLARELKGLGANHLPKKQNRGLSGKDKWFKMTDHYQDFCEPNGIYPATYRLYSGLVVKLNT